LLLFLTFSNLPRYAQASGNLGDLIGTINFSAQDLTSAHFAVIFSKTSTSVYDSLIQTAVSSSNWPLVFYIKRMAELDGYSSSIVDAAIKQALTSIPMTGHLPMTWDNKYFFVYQRYLLNGYRYASQYGVATDRWDKQQAYQELLQCYTNNGQPSLGYSVGDGAFSWGPRYYDETAETADALFKLGGSYSNLWDYTQSRFWSGSMYGYQGTSTFECEVGGFAVIWGSIGVPRDRILTDLSTKMLAGQWSSPAWQQCPGLMCHADGNGELRLENTLMGIQALHAFCGQASWKQSFVSMLTGGWGQSAWTALTSSPVFNGGAFGFRSGQSSAAATGAGLMLLFLEGIVPDTGSLAMPLIEESYEEILTGYPSTQFKFDYNARTIRIPINAGTLKFQFGSQLVAYNFPSSGLYDIKFSNDWNSIVSVNGGGVPQPKYGQVNVVATKNNQAVSFTAWIDSGTHQTVAASGYTFTSVSVGSHTVHGTELDGSNEHTQDITVAEGGTTPVNFDFSTGQEQQNETWIEQIIRQLTEFVDNLFDIDMRFVFFGGAIVFIGVLWAGSRRLSKKKR
jgi:hypothetical protein